MKILVCEDDENLAAVIKKRLAVSGFNVDTARDGEEGLMMIDAEQYDLVISDVMMPRMDGRELLRAVRRKKLNLPVLLLTAMDKTEDVVSGLDAGADDYMVKPFEFSELLARIRLLTRRSHGLRENVFTADDLEINTATREVKRGERKIELSKTEYDLLLFLVRNKNIVLSREKIAESIYSFESGAESNTIDVFISYLRKKVDGGEENKLIRTVRGVGYTIKCEK